MRIDELTMGGDSAAPPAIGTPPPAVAPVGTPPPAPGAAPGLSPQQQLAQAQKEKTERKKAINDQIADLMKQMAEFGNPNSLSDVAVGVLCIKTAVRGAWLNVLINAKDLSDKEWASEIVSKAQALLAKNHAECDEIVNKIEQSFKA
jgi:hypothetical protein